MNGEYSYFNATSCTEQSTFHPPALVHTHNYARRAVPPPTLLYLAHFKISLKHVNFQVAKIISSREYKTYMFIPSRLPVPSSERVRQRPRPNCSFSELITDHTTCNIYAHIAQLNCSRRWPQRVSSRNSDN